MNREKENLEKRHSSEREFHDAKYSGGDLYPRHYLSNPTVPIYRDMLTLMGDLSGKKVLEVGCGEGWTTVDLCRAGAVVDAFDISEQAVQNARVRARSAGVSSSCRFRTMAAETLEYDDNSFDVVFGFAILHHLDLDKAISEISRVLKPGGYAIFAEPLQGNPALRMYRRLTPQFRTPDERPFYRSELKTIFATFSDLKHSEYYLIGQASFALLYVPVIAKLFKPVHRFLWWIDTHIMNLVPFTGGWAWYSVMIATK